MSLSATLFGTDSAIFKATNILGLGIPGWLNKQFGAKEQKPTTQRIGELAQQTAKEGEPRPIVWGRVRPISGNIMHSSKPRIVRREVKGQSSGGKGGKKKQPKQYEERVFRTYAIRICEGPITAIVRVWRNNKLVYDARGNEWGTKNNGVFLKLAKFYLGGWGQMPDPSLESIWGSGEVPGYRGTCYMVSVDEDLTETGGAGPQYIFEVERAEGTYLTSRPYAVEAVDDADATGGAVVREAPILLFREACDATGGAVVSGEFRNPLVTYEDWPLEACDATGGAVISGTFGRPLVSYGDGLPEACDSTGGAVVSGVFRLGLVNYDRWPVESLDSSGGAVTGGSHG